MEAIHKLLRPSTSHSASDDPAESADHPSTHPDLPDGLMEFASFAATLNDENNAHFAAAMERPPAFWNHATSNAEHDALPPPYGFGQIFGPPIKIPPLPPVHNVKWDDHVTNSGFHQNQKKETTSNSFRCKFAVDTMCSPYSVISADTVKRLNLKTRTKTVTTSLADPESKITSSQIAEFELMIYWNAKRRTFKFEAMVWGQLPANQDLIIGMPDALSTGMIAFALPHEWRKSWLGTACFSPLFAQALAADSKQAEAQHFDLIMSQEDEELIDIGHILENPHICNDVDSLSPAAKYWLNLFPNLNKPIPIVAHQDLPKFDPPYDKSCLETYDTRKIIKVPKPSIKLGAQIDSTLGKLSDAGILNLHRNPVGMASFIVLVPKPDGTLRICCNFSKVNKALLVNYYPLPNCQDLLNQVSRKKFYTKIDLLHGFYNFDMAEGAKWLTATIAPGHAMTWNKVPQGLATVPSWFQWAMTTVLGNLVGKCCMIYIDDLIIFGNTLEEIHENTKAVLARLNQFDFRINIAKCQLEPSTTIDFLGHTISYDTIQAGPKSAKILENIKNPNHETKPKDKTDKLNTLVGILNWFSRYIPNLPLRMKPLLDAKAGGHWNWGIPQDTAFTDLRDALSNMETLFLPSGADGSTLEIHTDASRDGWFAVLFENTGIGDTIEARLRVVCMTGGIFRNSQLGWSILQKEAFAMFQAHKKFDHYIRLSPFTLCIDNKTLCYMENSSDPMVMRWYLRIQQYSSEIVHIPGSQNIVPDSGSRLFHLIHPTNTAAHFCSLISNGDSAKSTFSSCELQTMLLNRELDTMSAVIDATDETRTTDNWECASIRTCTPTCSTNASTEPLNFGVLAPRSESIAAHVSQLQQHGPPNIDAWVRSQAGDLAHSSHSISHQEQPPLLDSSSSVSSSHRPLPISVEHYNLIRTCHNAACGHFGRDETIRKLERNGMSWPSRFIDVARYIASCPQCQKNRLQLPKPLSNYKSILNHAPLFGRWHMDFLGIRAACHFTRATAILVMVEETSRYVMLWPLQSETSMEVLMAWLQTFAIFGIPEYLYSDGQSSFTADCIKEFRTLCGITHDFSIPKQAHTNGLAETNCKEVGKLVRMLCDELHLFARWSLLVPIIQRQLNCLTRSTLGCTANDIVFGPRANLERYIIPCAPIPLTPESLEAINSTDIVKNFIHHQAQAQSALLAKADAIQAKLLSTLTAQQQVSSADQLQEGMLVLVPWNDNGERPFKLAPALMGPYVVTRLPLSDNTVALSHIENPPPPSQPQQLISSVSSLRLYDNTHAVEQYDLPDAVFRQLSFNNIPIDCILDKRRLAIPANLDNEKDVRNFEYHVRWKVDSHGLGFPENPSWAPYSAISHTFAFDSFYSFQHRHLREHTSTMAPHATRATHQRQSVYSAAGGRH